MHLYVSSVAAHKRKLMISNDDDTNRQGEKKSLCWMYLHVNLLQMPILMRNVLDIFSIF